MNKQAMDIQPQYNGQCAFAVSLGKATPGSKKYSLTQDGNLYFFSNPVAKLLWKIIPNRKVKADLQWSN